MIILDEDVRRQLVELLQKLTGTRKSRLKKLFMTYSEQYPCDIEGLGLLGDIILSKNNERPSALELIAYLKQTYPQCRQ